MNRRYTFGSVCPALLLAGCIFGVGFGAVGCQNTAAGLKEDTQKNGVAVQNAAQRTADNTKVALSNAGDKTKDVTMDAGDAISMTPKVKDAILANPKLRDTKNSVNVNTKDGVVTLKGHVVNADEKSLAGQIAAKTVQDAGSKDKVVNSLAVQGQ